MCLATIPVASRKTVAARYLRQACRRTIDGAGSGAAPGGDAAAATYVAVRREPIRRALRRLRRPVFTRGARPLRIRWRLDVDARLTGGSHPAAAGGSTADAHAAACRRAAAA